ncbi:MAG TPA: hypothetical protein VND95_06515 [Stellaceae bacterium]|nr:hypothetical protein [Stellaceae bacterium]
MDEGRSFPLPVASGWAWEAPAKLRDAPSGGAAPQIAAEGNPAPTGEPASADIVAALITARDAERDRVRCLERDLRLLAGANKALRREGLSLQVRGWRDQETIAARDQELRQTRRALDAAIRRGRWLAREVQNLRSRRRLPGFGWLGGRRRARPLASASRPILAGEGSLVQRGFLLGEASAVVGAAVQRVKSAPSGTMVFGPYIKLAAGTYAVTVAARLYQRLPVVASFKVEIVCDGAQHVIEQRRVRLHSIARWRRAELVFTVWDGEDHPDFEIRIWARAGTPLEIGGIELCQVTAMPEPACGIAADADGEAAAA